MYITPITFSQNQPAATPAEVDLPTQKASDPSLNLVDPITSKRLRLYSPFTDQVLHLSPWQKLKLNLHETFVKLPKSVYHGLRGDNNYTFSNFLQVAKIPYYLGGAFLALSFAAGRDRVNFVRQGLGVGLYYLGVITANKLIDRIYQWRTGLDLGLRYRKSNGDIEKAWASVDFPRFDLLTKQDYEKLAEKMGIPQDITDPNMEVRDKIHQIISTSRADKLILGNFLAALGAGYLARSNAWARLLGKQGVLRAVWTDPKGGNLINRLANSALATWGLIERGVQEKITGFAGERNPMLRKGTLGAAAFMLAAIMIHSWKTPKGNRPYESAVPENLSSVMTSGVNPTQRSLANYKTENSAFAIFREHLVNGGAR